MTRRICTYTCAAKIELDLREGKKSDISRDCIVIDDMSRSHVWNDSFVSSLCAAEIELDLRKGKIICMCTMTCSYGYSCVAKIELDLRKGDTI